LSSLLWGCLMPTERSAEYEKLYHMALNQLIEEKGHITVTDLFLLREAVALTLLEHPKLEADE